MDLKQFIAKRAAKYFHNGEVINLGIGIPSFCPDYAEEGVMFQSENGFIGCGKTAEGAQKTENFSNATAIEFVPVAGACSFDSALSFAMIRSGRVSATVLGALEVAENGDLANWITPGRSFGMGGAMDLVTGVPTVIVAMELCTKDGKPKILKKCSLPLTGKACVDYIVTEYCVLDVTSDGLSLKEIRKGYTVDDIQKKIEPKLLVANDLKQMEE